MNKVDEKILSQQNSEVVQTILKKSKKHHKKEKKKSHKKHKKHTLKE